MKEQAIRNVIEAFMADKGISLDSVPATENLIVAGLMNSMDFLTLVATIEETIGIEVDFTEIDPDEFLSIDGLCALGRDEPGATQSSAESAAPEAPLQGNRSGCFFEHDDIDLDKHEQQIIEWIYDASNPALLKLLGSPQVARQFIAESLRLEKSEYASRGVTHLIRDGRYCGGMICLEGETLDNVRKIDALELLHRNSLSKDALLLNLQELAEVSVPLVHDAYYLSRIGLLPNMRNLGLGSTLIDEFLRKGAVAGFEKFRIDVSRENARALKLYSKFGFKPIGEGESSHLGIAYLTLEKS